MGSFVRLILRLWYIINIYHDRGSLDVYLLPSSSCLGPCILSFGSGGTGPCGCGLSGCLGASVTWSSKLFFPFTKNVVLFLSGHDVCWCCSSIIYFFVVSRLWLPSVVVVSKRLQSCQSGSACPLGAAESHQYRDTCFLSKLCCIIVVSLFFSFKVLLLNVLALQFHISTSTGFWLPM